MKLTDQITIKWDQTPDSVLERAWERFRRDVSMTLGLSGTASLPEKANQFRLTLNREMEPESYLISVKCETIHIQGGDELGIIYALLFISEKFLGVTPFWYWLDQNFVKKDSAEIPEGEYLSPKYSLRFRGWFINDEVLLDAWGQDRYDENTGIMENNAFEMAMEALLRLGGNMVIPGTDKNSHKYRKLAADMGLWITHHHAEPLGAKMFARAYPDLVPSYDRYPKLFEQLWREAVEEQKSARTVWNVGFRGQGDRPFWADDPAYDTPAARGALISSLIQKQCDLLKEYLDEPVCCTNLYGEVMELYRQGHITLPENVIYIWADNGYGKMVSRRQGSHNPRVEALPPSPEGRHGIYYHASFYDLQAASHITMLPNSTQFVEKELTYAMDRGVKDFLVVNCSNVRPHTYMLDKIARIWGKGGPDYAGLYFPDCPGEAENSLQHYFQVMLSYGPYEDDHAGEQFYHYAMRAVCHGWLMGRFAEPEPDLVWLTGECSLDVQIGIIRDLANRAREGMQEYYRECEDTFRNLTERGLGTAAVLYRDVVMVQAAIHYKSLEALLWLCSAWEAFQDKQPEGAVRNKRLEEAFLKTGQAVDCLKEALDAMQQACHGKWEGFYENDCLTDVKFTAYTLERVMGYIRNLGDGPHFYQWALKYMNPGDDGRVVLITNMRNHPKDWELYLAMKEQM